ncbi:MAG TPA: alpha/beta hydrolase domain-containing protein, partial [Vicinamibacterales bacterium]
MNSLLRKQFACLLVGVATVVCAAHGAAQGARPGSTEVTPVPKVTGPVPISSESVPFLAADRNLEPTDLKKHGYVEEEFIVTGTANVYDWAADGSLTVKTPNVPYGTRVLVRRPADPGRFSGDVVVEPLNTVRRNDWSWMWGYLNEQMLQHGDAWVGITLPSSSQALKKFNPARYAAVSFPNPTPTPCTTGGNNNAVSETEDGLKWDAISQVGALLKSNVASRPLAGYRVAALYMTEGQSPDPMTYINAIHSHANLANGKSVYDGYLVKQPGNPARINQCAPALDANDSRRTFKAINSPVIAVLAQGELVAALPWRRADSDAPGDRFRLYEIAGGSHIEWAAYVGMASFQEQTAGGIMPPGTPDWPIAGRCDPEIPLKAPPIMPYAFDAALANLEQWVRKGTPAPRAARIELKGPGTPQAGVVVDQAGNGVGGVRNPYVDVPAATFATTSPGPGTCRELGHKVDFDTARMRTL